MLIVVKVVLVILFGGLFYYFIMLFIVIFDDGVLFKWYYEVNVLIVVICGWCILGECVGCSYFYVILYSVMILVVIVFWVLLLYGFSEMIK